MDHMAVTMYTNASDIGVGAIFKNSWTMQLFQGDLAWMVDRSIAWCELYAIVLCVGVFGPNMANTCVKMYTDNQAILHCVNSGTCKDQHIMALLRSLYYYTTRYNIQYRAYYIPTYENGPSDSLSRNNVQRFRQLCPQADHIMTPACSVLLDF